MKKYFLAFCFVAIQYTYAQVGIGTVTPTEELEVVGDVLLTSTVETKLITKAAPAEDDFKFLARVNNSSPVGLIKLLESDNINVTPIRMQKYHFFGLRKDNVIDVDLGLDKSTYIVNVADFQWVGPGVEKRIGDATKPDSTGSFELNVAKQSGPNWHLKIQHKKLDPVDPGVVEYYVTLYIYQAAYFKRMPPVAVEFGGTNSGGVVGYYSGNRTLPADAGKISDIFQ